MSRHNQTAIFNVCTYRSGRETYHGSAAFSFVHNSHLRTKEQGLQRANPQELFMRKIYARFVPFSDEFRKTLYIPQFARFILR